MCGGSLFRTIRCVCLILNVLSFIAALGLLGATYYKFYAPGNQRLMLSIGLDKKLFDDIIVVAPLVIIVYILFVVGWIGLHERELLIVTVYGVVMYILSIILWLFSLMIYGKSHIEMLDTLMAVVFTLFENYNYNWEKLISIMWIVGCCGKLSWHDMGYSRKTRVIAPCCTYPVNSMTGHETCVYRAIKRYGCQEKTKLWYFNQLLVIRYVHSVTIFIWLATGVFWMYLALLMYYRPKEPVVVVERVH